MLVNIPELIIKDTVSKLIRYIKIDYDNQPDKNKTLLSRLLGDQTLQRYNFFEESKSVFLKSPSDPRYISVNMMFNRDRQQGPAIHIMLPSENETDMTLGIGEGELDFITDEDDVSLIQKTYNKRFRSSYNIVITSDNVNEVILIYHVLKSLMISANGHFNMKGLFNIKLSGRDMQINSELVPPHLFIKSLSMDCEYETGAIELLPIDYITDFDFEGTATLEIDDSVSN